MEHQDSPSPGSSGSSFLPTSHEEGFYQGGAEYRAREMSKRTLLIVDDETDHLFLMEMLLSKKNYRILLATSAAQALTIMRRRKIDLVISDFKMPGLDGTEMVSKMRKTKRLKDVPVIMLTAGEADLQMDALLSGVDIFCLKTEARKTLDQNVALLLAD